MLGKLKSHWPVILAASSILLFLDVFLENKTKYMTEGLLGDGAIALFFLLPMAQSVFLFLGSSKLRKLYSIYMFSSFAFFCFFWGKYEDFEKNSDFTDYSSYCIMCASFLVLSTVPVTWLIMSKKSTIESTINWGKLKSFATGISEDMDENPFPNIVFFLGIFLCVTYLLTFANAFNDKYLRERGGIGLYIKPLKENVKSKREEPNNKEYPTEETLISSSSTQKIGSWTIFFEQNSPEVIFDKSKSIVGGDNWAYYELNKASIDSFLKKVSNHKEDVILSIYFYGHTNKDKVSGEVFASNYELSLARAESVMLLIKDLISHTSNPPIVSLRSFGKSSTGEFASETLKKYYTSVSKDDLSREEALQQNRTLNNLIGKMETIDPLRSVEVVVEMENSANAEIIRLTRIVERGMRENTITLKTIEKKQNLTSQETQLNGDQLTLMDYLYFTVYTITTTGYGDIIPLSSRAKVIASIANFFELFFIVVFFNSLLNGARRLTLD